LLSKSEKELVRQLQGDIPLAPRPFAAIAERLGRREEWVIARTRKLLREKALRRIAAVLIHRRAGFLANGMGVWEVAPADCDRVGRIMASFPEVTHCYRRPRFSGWPYTLYTMIHGHTRAECRAVAKRLSKTTGITRYNILFSTREFKKTSPIYYDA
jgi:DNA-binding Lrp family transcriptional regulator